jgi:hypothetical protein
MGQLGRNWGFEWGVSEHAWALKNFLALAAWSAGTLHPFCHDKLVEKILIGLPEWKLHSGAPNPTITSLYHVIWELHVARNIFEKRLQCDDLTSETCTTRTVLHDVQFSNPTMNGIKKMLVRKNWLKSPFGIWSSACGVYKVKHFYCSGILGFEIFEVWVF